MKLNTRITLKFLVQVGVLFLVMWAIIGAAFGFYLFGRRTSMAAGGTSPSPISILQRMPQATTIHGNKIQVSRDVLAKIKQNAGWLQILDENGTSIYNFNCPHNVPNKYAPGELVYDKQNTQMFGYQLSTWYETVDHQKLTWLYGLPLNGTTVRQGPNPYLYVFLLFALSLFAALVSALLFGRRIGAPILHMMDWLQNLANESYAEPTDTSGIPKSKRVTKGELRRPYKIYRDVISALEHLATALQRGEIERKRLEQTREEWITGITHDLKTPLSSIKGYGDLFAESSYDWTANEIRQAGQVISEKATYMDGLVEDLGLTFRLRNEALPLQIKPENIIEIVRDAVINLVNHPRSNGQMVEFESVVDELVYPLDVRWFARALDNLVVNASLHNPVGTMISVNVQSHPEEGFRYPSVRIQIRDDGTGMNEETVSHLFDKYYRGTNTSEEQVKGSGLGTAIAKQLIEAHGGQISVNSTLELGTTVVVELPERN